MKRGTCELPDTIKFQCGDDAKVSITLAKAQAASQTVRDLIAERPVDDFCVILPPLVEKKTLDQVAAYIESDCKLTINCEPIECFLFALQYLQMETAPFHVALEVDLFIQSQSHKYDGFTADEAKSLGLLLRSSSLHISTCISPILFEPRADTPLHPVYSQLKDMLVFHIFPKFTMIDLFHIGSIHIWLYKWIYQYILNMGRRFWTRMTEVGDRQVFLAYVLCCLYGRERLVDVHLPHTRESYFPGIDAERVSRYEEICKVTCFFLIEEAAYQHLLEGHILLSTCKGVQSNPRIVLAKKYAFYVSTMDYVLQSVADHLATQTVGTFNITYAEMGKEIQKMIDRCVQKQDFNSLSKILTPQRFKQMVAEINL